MRTLGTAPAFPTSTPPPSDRLTVEELLDQARSGTLGPGPWNYVVAVAFVTLQRSRHPERLQTYTNFVVSLRSGRTVGSCFVEQHEVDQRAVEDCLGQTLAALLEHSSPSIRIAALDAYLGEIFPHERYAHEIITIPAGTSREKSLVRARSVVNMLGVLPGQRIALIGVVNSLVQAIHERGGTCLACDFNMTRTEWGDHVFQRMEDVFEDADAILATGMTLSNGSFDGILTHAHARGVPVVVFAQTGSAIAPQFLRRGVSGVSAEPYPFPWLTGDPSTLYRYVAEREVAGA